MSLFLILMDTFCASDMLAPRSPGNDLSLLSCDSEDHENNDESGYNTYRFNILSSLYTEDAIPEAIKFHEKGFKFLMADEDGDVDKYNDGKCNSTPKTNVIDSLEREIALVDFNVLTQTFLPKSPDSIVKVEEEVFETIYKEKLTFRRVTLLNEDYQVGWVVDHDINVCMCCGLGIYAFPLMMKKYHCRACGNITCFDCSNYTCKVSSLDEEGGSIICHNCFHEALMNRFTKFQRYDSFDVVRRNVVTLTRPLAVEDVKKTPVDCKVSNNSSKKQKLAISQIDLVGADSMKNTIPVDVYSPKFKDRLTNWTSKTKEFNMISSSNSSPTRKEAGFFMN